ncbi:MAG: LPS export ABC transporter permease LptG [Alphaproteobacteria bacterium]
MRLSPTFSFYIGRQFLFWLATVFLSLSVFILVIDIVELLRRGGGRGDFTFFLGIEMALLKLPGTAQVVLPFSVLFASLAAFFRLTRYNELVVARAAGVSAWQFLVPALFVVLVVGAFRVTTFNPFAATLLGKYEEMDRRYLRNDQSALILAQDGIWLRESRADGQAIINARSWDAERIRLSQIMIAEFDQRDQFVRRLDAGWAELAAGEWTLHEVYVNEVSRVSSFEERLVYPTSLTIGELENSLASPETVSFWDLLRYADLLEGAGFPGQSMRLQWHAMIAEPALMCGMVLIAAGFAMRQVRRGGTMLVIGLGVMISFGLYVFSDIVHALGLSARVPVELAAWAPAAVVMLIGLTMLVHLEDG